MRKYVSDAAVMSITIPIIPTNGSELAVRGS
jgi:hypothetical protein